MFADSFALVARPREIQILMISGFLLALTSSPIRAETVIGGSTPSERPEGAPRITEAVSSSHQEFEEGLKGVSKPYPSSLMFLKDQGNWFTPFTHRGMPAPYDLRNWYGDSPSNANSAESRASSAEQNSSQDSADQ